MSTGQKILLVIIGSALIYAGVVEFFNNSPILAWGLIIGTVGGCGYFTFKNRKFRNAEFSFLRKLWDRMFSKTNNAKKNPPSAQVVKVLTGTNQKRTIPKKTTRHWTSRDRRLKLRVNNQCLT